MDKQQDNSPATGNSGETHGPAPAGEPAGSPQQAGGVGPLDSVGPGQTETSALVLKIAGELERKRLTGVGGWLILFIVLYAFSLLALGFDLFMSAADPDPYYSMYVYEQQPNPLWRVSDFVKLGLIIAVYVCMAKHKKTTPLLCKLLVILEFLVGNLYLMLDPDLIVDELFETLSHSTVAGIYFVFSLGYGIAWYIYFSRSKRVRYTFVK